MKKCAVLPSSLLAGCFLLILVTPLWGGPSLPITNPPVNDSTILAGPPADPAAMQGQWFMNGEGTEEARSREFYDNTLGGFMGAAAISGYVNNIVYSFGPGTPIIAFSILATIWNDTTEASEWADGENSHGESLRYVESGYVGTLFKVKLTAEFAITDPANLPATWAPPYREREPFIIAENEDQSAWYCWAPDPMNPALQQGGYYVPTWDFGDIPTNQYATRQLDFSVPLGLLSSDPCYAVLEYSFSHQSDVLLNRSASLKVSTWIDELTADNGTPYPIPEDGPFRSSDVSVFHNLEEEDLDMDFGDAPEGAPAYPASGVLGQFPTCKTVGAPGSWIQHGLGWAHFGPGWDAEPDGNAGFCPAFNPNLYDQDECFGDGDAGLIFPGAFTITGAPGSEVVVPCPASPGTSLGAPCQVAMWGAHVDIWVVNNMPVDGYVNVLVDWNQDGIWSGISSGCPGGGPIPEHVLVNFLVPTNFAGPLSALLPPPFQIGPKPGYVWCRFSITETAVPLPWDGSGQFEDGETEDYLLHVQELDFGDAYDGGGTGVGHPTLLIQDGARHLIVPGVHLGVSVDAEPDGQPNVNADGDDLNLLGYPGGTPYPPGDEDGVLLPPVFIAGSVEMLPVIASTNGYLNAWIDWNVNGSWAEASDHALTNHPLVPGINYVPISVPMPPTSSWGGPHARWRFTTYPPATPSYTGLEFDGEVEDYEILIHVLDFGDAPAPYPTLLADDGARHLIPSAYYLGLVPPDAEPDGQPTFNADGDDINPPLSLNDEDGVLPAGSLIIGSNATLTIVASTSGWLNAWVDLDRNGDWSGVAEQVANDLRLTQGVNNVSFTVPDTAVPGITYGRFRFSSHTGLGYTGLSNDGEVEDYMFTIYQSGPSADLVITNLADSGSDKVVRWGAETGVYYETQWTTNMLNDTNLSWNAWGAYVMGPNHEQTDTNVVPPYKIYRVIAPYAPPP